MMVISKEEYMKAVNITKKKISDYVLFTEKSYSRLWDYVNMGNKLSEATDINSKEIGGVMRPNITGYVSYLIEAGATMTMRKIKKDQIYVKGAFRIKRKTDDPRFNGGVGIYLKCGNSYHFEPLYVFSNLYTILSSTYFHMGRIGIKNNHINMHSLYKLKKINEWRKLLIHTLIQSKDEYEIALAMDTDRGMRDVLTINSNSGINIYDLKHFKRLMSDEMFNEFKEYVKTSVDFFSEVKALLMDNKDLISQYALIEKMSRLI